MSDIDAQVRETDPVVRHVVSLIAPYRVARVTMDHQLIDQLGFHSLALAELAFALEDLFALDAITPERAMRLESVGDIAELISGALDAGDARLPTVDEIESLSAQYGRTWHPEG